MSYKLPTNEHGTSDGQQLTIDIRPLLEDVSQVMTKHISSILSGVVGEYTVYKETHDTIMGLPCVRKLQERISDLENQLNGVGPVPAASSAPASAASSSTSVPPAVSELQSAIVELNRYIQVLESRVDVKNVASQQPQQSEEAIRLEVHENDVDEADADADADDADESETVIPPSVHTNRIVESSSTAVEAEAEEEDTEAAAEAEDVATDEDEATAEAEEAEEEAAPEAEEEDTEAAAEAEDVATDEDEAAAEAEEEVATDEDEAAAEAEEEDTEEAEVEAEEDVATAEAEEDEAPEAEEEEIEVSEIKIKGVTYFTTNAQNGIIYSCVDDDVGDEVGVFKNGVALFSKNKAATKK
jgi:hypothetical protein